MAYETLIYEKEGGICTITLHRPKVYNAVNNQLADELIQTLREAERDEEIRVLILTGGDGKAFCSGQDLKAPENMQGKLLSHTIYRNYFPIITQMRQLAKPIICRLNGVAAGAGCSIALACDMIIANEEAELSQLFIHIGLVPDAGSSYFLTKLVSRPKAFELMTKGTKITAKEACELGIVNKAVPMEQLNEVVKAEATYYANAPTYTIGLIKKLINQSYHAHLGQTMELEASYQDIAGKTKDHQEGVMAFLQKRKPEFKGK